MLARVLQSCNTMVNSNLTDCIDIKGYIILCKLAHDIIYGWKSYCENNYPWYNKKGVKLVNIIFFMTLNIPFWNFGSVLRVKSLYTGIRRVMGVSIRTIRTLSQQSQRRIESLLGRVINPLKITSTLCNKTEVNKGFDPFTISWSDEGKALQEF